MSVNQLVDEANSAFSDDAPIDDEDAPRAAAQPKKRPGRPKGSKNKKPADKAKAKAREQKQQDKAEREAEAASRREQKRQEASAAYAELQAEQVHIGEGLAEILTIPLTTIAMVDPICGTVLIEAMPKIDKALETWAKSSPRVAKALKSSFTSAGPLMLMSAFTPLLVAVYAHHGPQKHMLFPPEQPNPEQPEEEPPSPFAMPAQ